MRSTMPAVLLSLLAGAASAQVTTSANSDKTTNSDQAKVEAESETVAEAREPEEFKPPPGFKIKRRGDITLYCIKGKATGTRFQTESCYDEQQLRDYLLAREQNNRDFDQRRAICANPAVCAP